MAASSEPTFADVLMILSGATFILWCLAFGAVLLGWQLADTTIGMIFLSFGVLTYLAVVFLGGGGAIWAMRRAKSLVLPLHPSSRRLIVATGFLIASPWVVFSILLLIRSRAW
jgi:CBS domain containing-hemolysin-like protein